MLLFKIGRTFPMKKNENSSSIPAVVLLSGRKTAEIHRTVLGWIQQLLCLSNIDLYQTEHPDLLVLPSDEKAKIKIDDIRNAIAYLQQSAHQGGNKIVVLAKADSMTLEACNALLKALEEPLPRRYLFLLSEYPFLLPQTLTSRCRKVSVNTNTGGERLVIDKERVRHIQDIRETLLKVQQGKLSVFKAGEKFQQTDFLSVLDALYYFCTEYFREQSSIRLFDWFDLINQTRSQVLSKHNPNQLLVLENIFYQWKKAHDVS